MYHRIWLRKRGPNWLTDEAVDRSESLYVISQRFPTNEGQPGAHRFVETPKSISTLDLLPPPHDTKTCKSEAKHKVAGSWTAVGSTSTFR